MESFEGLIVKQIAFKESSKILHVYTATGMISLLVHGAKKFKSPWLSASENLNVVNFQATGKNLLILTDAEVVSDYKNIKADLIHLTYAQHLLEIIHFFAETEYDHAKFYAFTKKILAKLDAETDFIPYIYLFELKFLFLLGVAPAFSACAACGAKTGLAFRVRSGGVACEEHGEGPVASPAATDWMRTLYIHDVKNPLPGPLPIDVTAEIRRIIDDYYAFHLNFRSKSRTMLSGLLGY
ncbi:MAG: DNA repair protein RecO [bacterium]